MDPATEKLKTIGIIHLVSGLLNVFMMAGVSYLLLSLFGGVCTGIVTLGMCPVGILCGYAGCLLIPVGIVEIIAGALLMSNPASAKSFAAFVPYIEIASILFGGLGSAIAGVVVMGKLKDEEVVAFLNG